MGLIDLSGKIALVTGGSRGIGRAIALTLVGAGARVVITYKENVEAAIETAQLGAPNIYPPAQMNVLDLTSIHTVIKAIDNGYDILVNNAGINIPGPIDEVMVEEWAQVVDTNLMGPWLVTREMLPHLNDGGSVVFIGSVSAPLGGPTSGHYAASKAGLVALCRCFAHKLAPRNIRCNVVEPGYIASPMAEAGAQSEAVRKMIEAIPLGRLGTAEEVAGVVAFLASDAASYVTAQTYRVNGGLYQ